MKSIIKKKEKIDNQQKIVNMKNEIETLQEIDYSPLYSQDVAYHNYGYIHTFRVISDGLRLANAKQFMAGVLAGIWISVAYTAVGYATYTISNPSVAKILFGIMFSGVIILIGFLGGGFVTAHMWYNRTMFKKVERWSIFLKACGLVYLGNIIGILLFVTIFQLSGAIQHTDKLGEYIYTILGIKKIYEVGENISANPTGIASLTASSVFKTIGWVFASAVLCNFLICLATQGAKSTKGNAVASIIMYLVVLFYFAIGGYQHCVANWYGGWMLLTGAIMESGKVLGTNVDGNKFYLNINLFWAYVIFNIIPAILGNFIGALIIGWMMGIFNKEYDVLLLQEARLKFLREELTLIEEKKMSMLASKLNFK